MTPLDQRADFNSCHTPLIQAQKKNLIQVQAPKKTPNLGRAEPKSDDS